MKIRTCPHDGMQGDGERFGEGCFFKADAVGDDMALGGFGDERLLESTLHMGQAHGTAVKPHVEAVVLLAFLAVFASSTGARRTDCDGLTNS